jgi:iron(III) transport system permease protein
MAVWNRCERCSTPALLFASHAAMSKPVLAVVYALTLAFFGAFFLWPIAQTVGGALFEGNRLTFAFIREVFRNEIYVDGLRNAFLLAVASTAATLLIALPLSFIADRFEFPGKKLLSTLVLVPMILPPFVGRSACARFLGSYGALNAALTKLGILSPDQAIDWLGLSQFWGIVVLNALHLILSSF